MAYGLTCADSSVVIGPSFEIDLDLNFDAHPKTFLL